MTTFSPPGDFAQAPVPQRTSVAAIISLICGILGLVVCCVPFVGPFFGIVGLICAIAAFMAIGRSDGRLGGNGLAVGGMICSIIAMIFGIVIVVGMSQFTKMFNGYGTAITIAQSDDTSTLSPMLSAAAGQRATPEGLAAFKTESLGSLGAFQRIKPGMMPFFKSFAMMGQLGGGVPPKYQGRGGGVSLLPAIAEFEKGEGLFLIVFNQNEQTNSTLPFGNIENIGVAPAGGPVTWLIDPALP